MIELSKLTMSLNPPPLNQIPNIPSPYPTLPLPEKISNLDPPAQFEFVEGWIFKTYYKVFANLNFVRVERKGFGLQDIVEIPTHRITGIEYGFRSKPILLIISSIIFLYDIFLIVDISSSSTGFSTSSSMTFIFFLFMISIILVVIYLMTRKQLISISSEDRFRPLWFYVEGVNSQILLNFITKLENKYTKIRLKELT